MKTVFITGCNRGLGLGFTKVALMRGMRVIGSCRNPDGARDLWELQTDYKDRFRIFGMDVTEESSVEAAIKQLPSDTVVDILINNAGLLLEGELPLKQVDMEGVMKSMQVNAVAPMIVTRTLLPMIKVAQTPIIANMSSLMGSIEDNKSGRYYSYRMSKAALNMFTKCLANDFPNIISVSLHPGWVKTDMGGANAPLNVLDSCQGLMNVLLQLKKADSGKFIDYSGKRLPW